MPPLTKSVFFAWSRTTKIYGPTVTSSEETQIIPRSRLESLHNGFSDSCRRFIPLAALLRELIRAIERCAEDKRNRLTTKLNRIFDQESTRSAVAVLAPAVRLVQTPPATNPRASSPGLFAKTLLALTSVFGSKGSPLAPAPRPATKVATVKNVLLDKLTPILNGLRPKFSHKLLKTATQDPNQCGMYAAYFAAIMGASIDSPDNAYQKTGVYRDLQRDFLAQCIRSSNLPTAYFEKEPDTEIASTLIGAQGEDIPVQEKTEDQCIALATHLILNNHELKHVDFLINLQNGAAHYGLRNRYRLDASPELAGDPLFQLLSNFSRVVIVQTESINGDLILNACLDQWNNAGVNDFLDCVLFKNCHGGFHKNETTIETLTRFINGNQKIVFIINPGNLHWHATSIIFNRETSIIEIESANGQSEELSQALAVTLLRAGTIERVAKR